MHLQIRCREILIVFQHGHQREGTCLVGECGEITAEDRDRVHISRINRPVIADAAFFQHGEFARIEIERGYMWRGFFHFACRDAR